MENYDANFASVGASELVFFAGDNVRLAGQIDYPNHASPQAGYPLIFVIQHATSKSLKDFDHITKLASEMSMTVFRWDKRGTGKSGGGSGNVEIDTIKAYETAVQQPGIDATKVVIVAQNEGTILLGEVYQKIKAIQKPAGVVLVGSMLDERAIMVLDVPVHIVASKNDWNAWQTYAEIAADTHAARYNYTASFYVATNTNRLLMLTSGNTFHRGAEKSIQNWLNDLWQNSK